MRASLACTVAFVVATSCASGTSTDLQSLPASYASEAQACIREDQPSIEDCRRLAVRLFEDGRRPESQIAIDNACRKDTKGDSCRVADLLRRGCSISAAPCGKQQPTANDRRVSGRCGDIFAVCHDSG